MLRRSLWSISGSSGLSGTGSIGPVQVGGQFLNLYMDWNDPSGGPVQSYEFHWYCVGMGVGWSKFALPFDLRGSTANMFSKGSPVYLGPRGGNYLLERDLKTPFIGDIVMLTLSAELAVQIGFGFGVSIIFFGCPIPPIGPGVSPAALPAQVALCKGVALLMGEDRGTPGAGASAVYWTGIPRPRFRGY